MHSSPSPTPRDEANTAMLRSVKCPEKKGVGAILRRQSSDTSAVASTVFTTSQSVAQSAAPTNSQTLSSDGEQTPTPQSIVTPRQSTPSVSASVSVSVPDSDPLPSISLSLPNNPGHSTSTSTTSTPTSSSSTSITSPSITTTPTTTSRTISPSNSPPTSTVITTSPTPTSELSPSESSFNLPTSLHMLSTSSITSSSTLASSSQSLTTIIATSTFLTSSKDSSGRVTTFSTTQTETQTAALGTNTNDSNDFAHNKGAIIGVALAVAFFVICASIGAFLLVARRRRKKKAEVRSITASTAHLRYEDEVGYGSSRLDIEDVPVVMAQRPSEDISNQTGQYEPEQHTRSLGQMAETMAPALASARASSTQIAQDRLSTISYRSTGGDEGAWLGGRIGESTSSHGHGQSSSQGHGQSSSHGHGGQSSHGHDTDLGPQTSQGHGAPSSSHGHSSVGSQQPSGSPVAPASNGSHASARSSRVQFSDVSLPPTQQTSPSRPIRVTPPTSFSRTSSRERVRGILSRLRGGRGSYTPDVEMENNPFPRRSSMNLSGSSILLTPLSQVGPAPTPRSRASDSPPSSPLNRSPPSPHVSSPRPSSLLDPPPPIPAARSSGPASGSTPSLSTSSLREHAPSLAGQMPSSPLSNFPAIKAPTPKDSPAVSDQTSYKEGLLHPDRHRIGATEAVDTPGSTYSLRDYLDYSRPIRPADYHRLPTTESIPTLAEASPEFEADDDDTEQGHAV